MAAVLLEEEGQERLRRLSWKGIATEKSCIMVTAGGRRARSGRQRANQYDDLCPKRLRVQLRAAGAEGRALDGRVSTAGRISWATATD